MSIYGNTRFKAATEAKTPQYAAAMARQHQLNQQDKARVNSLRSQNVLGGAKIYNSAMESQDKSPITDAIRGWFGDETAAAEGIPTDMPVVEAPVEAPVEVAPVDSGLGSGLDSSMANVDALRTGGDVAAQTAEQLAAQQAAAAAEQAAAEAAALAAEQAAAQSATTASSSMSSLGPWMWLAQAINANETGAQKAGRRDEDDASYRTDLATGAVMEQDAAALGEKWGGAGGEIVSTLGQTGNPEGNLDLLKDFGENIGENPFDPLKLFS